MEKKQPMSEVIKETIDKVKEEKKALASPTPDLDKLIEEETINLKL